MCGVAGILRFDARDRVDPVRLERMRDALRHRGPDGGGLFVEGPIGLAHRRLAIVDAALGHQPMKSADGTLVVSQNGEIYNHEPLRALLSARGRRYRTRCDTETILHLYAEHGDAAVERLRGMFAFALWDGARRRLLLARDRLGIKPLYYALGDRELVFASEIKAILAAGSFRATLNVAALPEFLASRFVAGQETLFEGVRPLAPGTIMTWSAAEGIAERRYWSVPSPSSPAPVSLREGAEDLRARLEETVRAHLMSDGPVGVLLSGGIDSSALAALAAPMLDRPLDTFAVGFEEADANELAYARLAAEAARARHHEVVLTSDRFFEALPRLVWHEDEPPAFPSSVPLYFVSRLAAERVKVVLTGEGADELFLGYNRYRVTRWNDRLGRLYAALAPARARAAVRGALQRLPDGLRRYAERSCLALEPTPRDLFYENFAVFRERMLRRLLAAPHHLDQRDPYAPGLAHYTDGPGDSLDRMSRADLQTYLVELLMKQDRMSMAASIESRVPFLDHLLVEHVLALPPTLKLRGITTKAVLRRALSGVVPDEILRRPKWGFPVPIDQWLRGRHRAVVEEFVLGERTRKRGLFDHAAVRQLAAAHAAGARHGDRLWLLITLEIWMRIFLDGEEPGAIRVVERRMTRPTTAPARRTAVARVAARAGSIAAAARPLPRSGPC